MKKALIAMSGGVDSSVAAYLTKEAGYECMGTTMKLYTNEEVGICTEKTCCMLDDVNDARIVAEKMDIPYYVYNFSDLFEEKVIKKFADTYMSGGTPNPCIDCNRFIKFDKLMSRMNELGFDYVVTGHYARVEKNENTGRFELKKGLDDKKDQSYVLFNLTQEQLSHTLFPLGGFTKQDIRKIANEQNFVNANKHESQDICFVPDGDYASFIERYTRKKFEDGDFVDKNGNFLGRHKGIIRYTVGQRKGLGIAAKRPLYVCKIDIKNNKVILGDNEDVFGNELIAGDINLISVSEINDPIKCTAKIRYKHKEAAATVSKFKDDKIKVVFDEPQRGITKGQAVVLYDNDIVIGGGIIE